LNSNYTMEAALEAREKAKKFFSEKDENEIE